MPVACRSVFRFSRPGSLSFLPDSAGRAWRAVVVVSTGGRASPSFRLRMAGCAGPSFGRLGTPRGVCRRNVLPYRPNIGKTAASRFARRIRCRRVPRVFSVRTGKRGSAFGIRSLYTLMYHACLSPDFYNLSAAACGRSLRIRLGCYYEISFVGSDFIRGKTGRIGNSKAGTVNGYNWGGIILMLFHVLASPDRVVRVGRSISDRRVFREGQGARFRPGKRASSGREALLAPLLVVLGQFAQRVDQRAGERFAGSDRRSS